MRIDNHMAGIRPLIGRKPSRKPADRPGLKLAGSSLVETLFNPTTDGSEHSSALPDRPPERDGLIPYRMNKLKRAADALAKKDSL